MLGIDKFHVRPSCDRVADRKGGVRQHAKNIDYSSRAQVFDQSVRHSGLAHRVLLDFSQD
jgi:hypothetical protein